MSSDKRGNHQRGKRAPRFTTVQTVPQFPPRLALRHRPVPQPADPSLKLKSRHQQASPHPRVPSQLLAVLRLLVAVHWGQGQAGTKVAAGKEWWVPTGTWATGG